jgi:uncharacterized metal-binding protein
MSDSNDEVGKEKKAIIIKFWKSLNFVLSVGFELCGAAAIVGGIRVMEAILSHDLKIFGWEIHQIALVAESFVLFCFIVCSMVSQMWHMFGHFLYNTWSKWRSGT